MGLTRRPGVLIGIAVSFAVLSVLGWGVWLHETQLTLHISMVRVEAAGSEEVIELTDDTLDRMPREVRKGLAAAAETGNGRADLSEREEAQYFEVLSSVGVLKRQQIVVDYHGTLIGIGYVSY